MTIRADLHVHSKVCKDSTFSHRHFESTVERARHMGLSGFALTEHMHAPGYWNTLNDLVRRYGYRDGHFALADGFNVLTGAELTVAERADVILIEASTSSDSSIDRSLPCPARATCHGLTKCSARPGRQALL